MTKFKDSKTNSTEYFLAGKWQYIPIYTKMPSEDMNKMHFQGIRHSQYCLS